jgi:hypothetical protein
MEKLAEQCHQNLVHGGEVDDVSWRRRLGPAFARLGALSYLAMEPATASWKSPNNIAAAG